MLTQPRHVSRLTGGFLTASAMALGLAATGSAGAGQEMPNFRRGMWEFNRTMVDASGKTQTIVMKKCTNPSDDMKKQNDMLAKAGCKLSAVTRSADTYSSTSQCTLQGITVQSRSVISVDSDSAYKVNVESQEDGAKTRELLVARRTGDC